MSDSSDSPSLDNCISALYDPSNTPTNADVDGIAVSVANIVVHLCLRILITWSPGDIDEGIQALLLQIYPILLSTLLSIGRKQLSLFDANFALILTSSPLTVYLVVVSTCDWFGIETGLYKRIKSHRPVVRTLGTLVPFLWFGLSVTLRLSDRAFIDSRLCQGSTFWGWLQDLIMSAYVRAVTPGDQPVVGLILVFIPVPIVLITGWRQARREGRSLLGGQPRPRRPLRSPWAIVRWAWRTLTNCKWYIYPLFTYFDASWMYNVVGFATTASQGYVLSYGQVLSLFAVVPPVISTIILVYVRRLDLLRFFRSLPRHVLTAVRLVPGTKQAPHAPGNSTPSPPGLMLQDACCEARSEESQPEGPSTPGLPDSPAHPRPQRDCSLPRCDQSSTSLVADIPLANIILAHRDDTMTTESVEQACDVHESSPPIMEPVMQIFTEDACEQQKDVEVNETSRSAVLANVTPMNAAYPTARRGWTYG